MRVDSKLFVREIIKSQAKMCCSDLQLSEKTGIHINTIRRIKRDESVPRIETVGCIANFLGIDIDRLIVSEG